MKDLFDRVSFRCSEITTLTYSTSFSKGVKCLSKDLRNPIYSIYGFVRFSDEIVYSFNDYNKHDILTGLRRSCVPGFHIDHFHELSKKKLKEQ